MIVLCAYSNCSNRFERRPGHHKYCRECAYKASLDRGRKRYRDNPEREKAIKAIRIAKYPFVERLRRATGTSKGRGYAAPNVTAGQMETQWVNQKGICIICRGGKPITLEESNYHHSHDTGEGFGFTHPYCNLAEGYLLKLEGEERLNFISWMWPDLSSVSKQKSTQEYS